MLPRDSIFADSAYFIALNATRDDWRDAARRAQRELHPQQRIVTSTGVFAETLAHFSRSPRAVRARVARELLALRDDPFYTIVPHDWQLTEAALDLYTNEFANSTFSLQDCVAIVIMREYGITTILTADQEFARAGFTPLLRRYLD